MGKITVKLYGGLGNQLFQIFATINTALKNNMSPVFPNIYKVINPGYTQRYTYYHLFPTLEFENKTSNFVDIDENQIEHVNFEDYGNLNFKLLGYFQSYRFLDIIDPYDYLKLDRWDTQYINDFFNTKVNKDKIIVSLHVRRGDYLKAQGHHIVLNISYYKNALEKLKEKGIDNCQFLIFSEDLEWCHENLGFLEDKIFVNEKDYIEMFIMARCNHNIISNSTFSWWGAYLNKNSSKIVVYPEQWEVNNLETSELCPEEWIICSNE